MISIHIFKIPFYYFFQSLNLTDTSVIITGLEKNERYQFFAISRNSIGTSLPTAMLTLNISSEAWDGKKVVGKPSAPHGIELDSISANFLTFSWTAPVISDHKDLLKYRYKKFLIYEKCVSEHICF